MMAYYILCAVYEKNEGRRLVFWGILLRALWPAVNNRLRAWVTRLAVHINSQPYFLAGFTQSMPFPPSTRHRSHLNIPALRLSIILFLWKPPLLSPTTTFYNMKCGWATLIHAQWPHHNPTIMCLPFFGLSILFLVALRSCKAVHTCFWRGCLAVVICLPFCLWHVTSRERKILLSLKSIEEIISSYTRKKPTGNSH